MNFHVLTLFPDMIMQSIGHSITGRAIKENLISVEAIDIRDYTKDKHRKVDDYPYGGGAGMLMQAQPVYDAFSSVVGKMEQGRTKRVIYVTPQGRPFNQRMAEEFASSDDLIFVCGHYEGIDERVLEEIITDYVSIGDYVLTGGELPALVMMDAVARLVPGVLGNDISSDTESFHGDLLEYPQYSRPAVWHGKEVPKVLLSGNEREIKKWRMEQSVLRTKERRPDLYDRFMRLENWKTRLLMEKRNHIDMIECIQRGNAVILAETENELCILDKVSNVCYHTCLGMPVTVETVTENIKFCVVLHQQAAKELLLASGGWEEDIDCYLLCYTNKEKLPITGLYRNDGLPREDGFVIKQMTLAELPYMKEHYTRVSDEEYQRFLISNGRMYGAFFGEKQVGFIGKHDTGEIGLLFVEPEYRQRHIGTALETFLINKELEAGNVPYGAVIVGNTISDRLQEKLGLYKSKNLIHWMNRIP